MMLAVQQSLEKRILGLAIFLLLVLYFLCNREQARPSLNDNGVAAIPPQLPESSQREAFIFEAERSLLGIFDDTAIQELCRKSSWVSSSDTIVHCHRIFGGIGEWQRPLLKSFRDFTLLIILVSKCETRDSRLPTTYHGSWGRPDSPNNLFTG